MHHNMFFHAISSVQQKVIIYFVDRKTEGKLSPRLLIVCLVTLLRMRWPFLSVLLSCIYKYTLHGPVNRWLKSVEVL